MLIWYSVGWYSVCKHTEIKVIASLGFSVLLTHFTSPSYWFPVQDIAAHRKAGSCADKKKQVQFSRTCIRLAIYSIGLCRGRQAVQPGSTMVKTDIASAAEINKRIQFHKLVWCAPLLRDVVTFAFDRKQPIAQRSGAGCFLCWSTVSSRRTFAIELYKYTTCT